MKLERIPNIKRGLEKLFKQGFLFSLVENENVKVLCKEATYV